MDKNFRNFFIRYNYNDEKGFTCQIPTSEKNVHLSIAFNNKSKEFNIHFTDDNIKKSGAKRYNFILVMSAFRFFLLINRFEKLYDFNHLKVIRESKTSLGKLKKNGFMIFHLPVSVLETKLLHISQQGKKIRFRKNSDLNALADGFHPVTNIHSYNTTIFQAYKWKGEHLSFQGIIFKPNISGKLYFVPKKKYNRFLKQSAIAFYNYINKYPTPETLEFRKIAFDNLKHPYQISK
ncbi:hypothetical protein [Aequorivita capsosiphonis]|uniref:hypothetical protein n=1 Tax=Aequorivita capsosiphonis TaxID=487317 RepID=UPI00047D25EA|nr:hypothetical protein [Aequorivita capsosiphonis]